METVDISMGKLETVGNRHGNRSEVLSISNGFTVTVPFYKRRLHSYYDFILYHVRCRASSVRDFLLNQGIEPRRTRATGYGERYPIASNDTAAGREQNRRVELTLVPMQ